MDVLKRSLGFAHGLGVGSFRRGGGLALFWTSDIDVKLQSYYKLHIDVTVLDLMSKIARWRLTGFYEESRRELRYRS